MENYDLKRQVGNFLTNSENQDNTLNKILNIIYSEICETNYKNFIEKLNQKFNFTINSTIKLNNFKTIKVLNDSLLKKNKNINNLSNQKHNCAKLLSIETVTIKTKKGNLLCVSRVLNLEKILKYKIIQLQKTNSFIEFIDERFKDEIWFTLVVDKG